MAEIHIVRKRRGALWLALAGIALLLLALWALWGILGSDEPVDATVDASDIAAVNGVDDQAAAVAPLAAATDAPDAALASGASDAPLQDAATATPEAQATGEQTGRTAVPIAPPVEQTPAQRAVQSDAAIAPPARRPVAARPAMEFVVPDVDAKATPIDVKLRSPYVGRFVSDSITLFVREDGTYEITRSAAGPGRGTWTVLREHDVLFADPADGSQDRYFRIRDADTLIPLNPRGKQPAQMTELLRRQRDGAPGR